ncbi:MULTISPECIES: hypothetical protein [Mucilaginibacter]|uniref:Uncharacterized protein n=1 Tax=Mucilaginibacter rubeus TaxID=2027860 RepID=A0ABX7U9V3_9SPHI|nr:MULTISPECIES: hypothetical protein [Mucilaginibacter]QTE42941.1 hypothetical protein J3L19_29140 [Mucilaginibacter rubeus]QTE49542.1 hypothetical protein J3L21_29100 [Mucilaginibacter rubeus]QTE54638.1 hypothetical protein J3L23_20725 [Mucilaginibacter rubeus]QTE65908.1 hypothetical protein J3L22_13105 [Mucilaginibacter rubeus]QTF64657.1 hypothetical protein J3L20_12770 [Mucilaginibacter rubeus]
METKRINRKVTVIEDSTQWKLHQLFGEFVSKLDRLPDAREVQQNPLRSAPKERTVMVF